MRLARELYSARYMGKLMEATAATGDVLLLYVRQQVIIYASIYEAIIDYLLFTKYKRRKEVASLTRDHEFIEVRVQPGIVMTFRNGNKKERLVLCRVKQTTRPVQNIRFKDRLATAVSIGFISQTYARDLQKIYDLRNSIHLVTATKRNIEIGIAESRLAYRRTLPIIDGIKSFVGQA
jgi:hypothetical protein